MKAFPNGLITNKDGLVVGGQQGMDLRDWFAGLAMQSLIPIWMKRDSVTLDMIVKDAYSVADEMMARRDK